MIVGRRGRDAAAIRAFERSKWDAYFADALAGRGQEHDRNLWWRVSDDDTLDIIEACVERRHGLRVLEAACGSGGTSFLIAERLPVSDITFVDISRNALRFARTLETGRVRGRARYVEADVFALPFADGAFDLAWNVGTIEHYPPDAIRLIVGELLRVTAPGGSLVLAIPNAWNIAVLKAWVLGTRLGRAALGWVPGYRFDSEILYRNGRIADLIRDAAAGVTVTFAGNCLWASAPDGLVALTQRILPRSKLSFLTFFVATRARDARGRA